MHRKRHLQNLLDAFQPADPKEATDHAQMLALLASEGDPFSRHSFTPGHFTASAFVLSPNTTKLLLIFHGKLHRWLQPGGHIDAEDTDTLAAARREVLEETGLSQLDLISEGLFDLDIHTIPARKNEPTHLHFDLRFLFRSPTEEIFAASDAHAARWMPLSLVHTLDTDHSVLRATQKLEMLAH
jgi:8-oxo-dGTP pyrophosphatase MutT (NUDIX family)